MDKHFEPITARSLAEKSYELIMTSKVPVIGWKERVTETIEKLLEPHIRKPSDENKSVPQRCEEAYNEAIRIIHTFVDTYEKAFIKDDNSERAHRFLKKPNPFKEADIVKEDKTEPTLLPFSLEDAKNGAKVVTTAGRYPVKILCDDLDGEWPILGVYTDFCGHKRFDEFSLKGQRKDIIDDSLNLFILKEPRKLEINIYKHKKSGNIYFWTDYKKDSPDYEFIKTITTTI